MIPRPAMSRLRRPSGISCPALARLWRPPVIPRPALPRPLDQEGSPCVVCLYSPCVVCPLLSLWCCLSLFPLRSQTQTWVPAGPQSYSGLVVSGPVCSARGGSRSVCSALGAPVRPPRPGGPQSRPLRPGGPSPSAPPWGLQVRLLRPGGLQVRLLRPGGLQSRLALPVGSSPSSPPCFHMDLALRPSPCSAPLHRPPRTV